MGYGATVLVLLRFGGDEDECVFSKETGLGFGGVDGG